jgi:hypothetical protein
MQIMSRLSISDDGYVTTPDGWPAQLADPHSRAAKATGSGSSWRARRRP